MLKKLKTKLLDIFILILTIPILVPFYMLVVNSFKTKAEAAEMTLKLPTEWNIIENYRTMAEVGNIFVGFKNSAIITVLSVALTIIVSAITAFIIQRRKEKFSNWIFIFLVLGLFIPGFTVPTVLLIHRLHIPKLIGLILMNVVGGLPMGIFLYVRYLKSIPREIDEAAIIDGCGLFRLFMQIIMPLVTPITATYAIISVLSVWNDFAMPLYLLSGSENQTITLAMFNFFGPHSADWNLVFACIVVSTLPVIIIYFTLQKYIIAGMVGGSVKG